MLWNIRGFSLAAMTAMLGMSHGMPASIVSPIDTDLGSGRDSFTRKRTYTKYFSVKYRGGQDIPRKHPLGGLRKAGNDSRVMPIELDADYRKMRNALKRERRAARP